MRTLRERIAVEIDRASQFDNYTGTVFELCSGDNSLDPDIKRYKEFILKCSDRIIKMVENELKKND